MNLEKYKEWLHFLRTSRYASLPSHYYVGSTRSERFAQEVSAFLDIPHWDILNIFRTSEQSRLTCNEMADIAEVLLGDPKDLEEFAHESS